MRGAWILLLFLVCVLPVSAQGLEDKFQTGERITLRENTQDNFYAIAPEVRVESDIGGDLVVAGGAVPVDELKEVFHGVAGAHVVFAPGWPPDLQRIGPAGGPAPCP